MELIELKVTVDNIVFQTNDDRFCVFRVSSKGTGTFTATYKGPAPFIGEVVSLSGEWTEHARFGKQFQVHSWKSEKPTDEAGIERFLASGAIKGVGPSTASRIIEHFGADTLRILDNEPERLQEVSGIGQKKADDIIASYQQLSDTRELMIFLESNGVSSNYAPRLLAAYGNTAITRIKNNPYCLARDIAGIGFRTADKIAQAMGVDVNSQERLRAGLSYALETTANQGHTCVPEEYLIKQTSDLLQASSLEVREAFNDLCKEDLIRTETLGGVRLAYTDFLYQAEVGVAHRLIALRDNVNKLWNVDYGKVIAKWQQDEGLELAPEQKKAVEASVDEGVFILTGGPGTGKTTVIKGIISVLAEAGCKILLAAPTGRAAKRLAEASGREALTVHRMLEYTPQGDVPIWGRNADNPLEADAIIIDEASMLDIALAFFLLRAVPIGCRLILVGDVDQLPSVGPGSVLKDIITSKAMPIVRLENVFRQAELSPIIRNAHRINHGQLPELTDSGDFTFVSIDDEISAAKYIVDTYAKLAVSEEDWQNIQVLSPMHKNPCGVENLNKLLQERVNPPAPDKQELRFGNNVLREGDKVMQMRNNYEKDVFNGDLGRVRSINGRLVTVYFPDRQEGSSVTYESGELDDLSLSYAMSVHKSQGSEYATVILPLVTSHFLLLQRNLFYTGITRAKKQVILVGSKKALYMAVENDKTRKRYSLLAERLQDTVGLV
jgi:exodeoxyribonuclease V alpha subunit